MQGLMQDWPLTVDKILDHAKTWHGDREVVSRSVEGPIVRTTYAQIHARAKQVSNALLSLGITLGDRVATMAWCTGNHMDAWYGIMGIGAICHTLNPRLHPQQLAWIVNHAGDRVIFTDLTFQPLIEGILPYCPSVEHVVFLTDAAHMPAFTPKGEAPPAFKGAIDLETLIAGQSAECAWGGFDENTAGGLCYTSGTTGDPKGVLYSHRSNFLHTLTTLQTDVMGVSARDTVLAVVPMFHANGWGLAFGGPASGAKLVMPGAKLDGASLYELIETEQVTFTAAVPTVWQGLLQYLAESGHKFTSLKGVLIGGAAVSESTIRAFRDSYGVEVTHAWGMTETSPLGTVSRPSAAVEAMPEEERMRFALKQGRPPLGIELKVTDDAGAEAPKDGHTFGHLKVRGPFVAAAYFRGEGSILDTEGFFDTGDVATLDDHGYMQITDRSKDVIKSGGEWISSIEIENIALGYPKTALAAVIGRSHPKWDERPLMIVKLKDGETATAQEYLDFLHGKIAKWWTPDDVVFVDDIPLGATGKIDKKLLRTRFEDYVFPAVAAAAATTIAEAAVRPPVLYAAETPEAPIAEGGEAPDTDQLPAEALEPEAETTEAEAPVAEVAELVAPEPETVEAQAAESEIIVPDAIEEVSEAEVEPVIAPEPEPEPDLHPEPVAAAEPEPVVAAAPPPATEEAPLMFASLSPPTRKPPAKTGGKGDGVLLLDLVLGLTLLPVVLVVVAALAARMGVLDWNTAYGVMTVEWAPKIALIGVVAAVLGGVYALFGGAKLGGRAMLALFIAIATLGVAIGLRTLAAQAPVSDVATDWREPITFTDRTMADRGPAANPVDFDPILPVGSGAYAGRRVADINTETCPGARPLSLSRAPSDAYEAARDAVRDAGLSITHDDPATGRLEAVATALAYGSKDDVAVRVRPLSDGARVDIRSISRQGTSDLGRNCRRVTRILGRVAG